MGSPVAERVSRQGHVLDGGLALDWWSEDGVPLPWNWDGGREPMDPKFPTLDVPSHWL